MTTTTAASQAMLVRYAIRGAAWAVLYLLMILAPLFVLLVGPLPAPRDFWTEFSVALGFTGLAMMGLQFGLTARFRHITTPWGEDVIYHFHRRITLLAFVLVLAHPLLLFVTRPETLALLNFIEAPWRARFAVLSVVALLVLIVMAVGRARWKLRYETWHLWHNVLAVAAVVLAMLHMLGVGYYISTPWKQALWIALAALWLGLLLYVRIIKPLFLLRRPYRVVEVRPERGDAATLVMQPDGHAGFRFSPGQFGWLTVWGSPFRLTEHPFSFSSSAAANDGRVEMTIRNLGDFTRTIPTVQPGQRVYVDGPYGAFTIDRNPADMLVFVAGGVGITPMMSMMRTLADRGDTRPVLLFYGSRDWESIIFREQIEALQQRLALTVIYVLEKPHAGWQGESGFISAELFRRHLPPPYAAHEYFICGPNVMMDAIERALGQLGVPLWQYHSERYNFI
jgi:predicted ferric reductase